MHPLVNIAVKAARQAGQLIMQYRDRIDKVTITEKAKNDFVTDVDQQSEAIIIDIIHKAYPDHCILAEESGTTTGKDALTWIIDPLDGTRNYVHGFPQFCVSIAIREHDKLQHAVIYDPVLDELYIASRGCGARLNNRRIRVSQREELGTCLIATGFPFRQNSPLQAYLRGLEAVLTKTGGIRRAGSAALDLAYVAAGRLDGFWEFGLNTWDVAAGALLIVEAGGIVRDIDGSDNYLDSGNIITANPKILVALQAAVQQSV
jgi:myo-inositol-1(or 4)-monophosphatase